MAAAAIAASLDYEGEKASSSNDWRHRQRTVLSTGNECGNGSYTTRVTTPPPPLRRGGCSALRRMKAAFVQLPSSSRRAIRSLCDLSRKRSTAVSEEP